MSEKIIIAFKSVLNCLLLTNYLKSWPFYFQDLRVDLLNLKPYSVCFRCCWEYAWDCFNPLTPRSDSHVTSPYNIHPLSNKQVMRVLKCIR